MAREIHVDFLPNGVTMNAQYHGNLLQKKRPGKLSKIILLHDNACSYTKNLMGATSTTIGWEIMNHSPYSSYLAPVIFICLGQ
jgi:hypothetical protein